MHKSFSVRSKKGNIFFKHQFLITVRIILYCTVNPAWSFSSQAAENFNNFTTHYKLYSIHTVHSVSYYDNLIILIKFNSFMFLLFSSYNFDLIYSEQKTYLLTKIPVVNLHRRYKDGAHRLLIHWR